MTKQKYYEELHALGLVKRKEVTEIDKDKENVVRVDFLDDTYVFYEYATNELTDNELDRMIKIKSLKQLNSINKILKFFFVFTIASICIAFLGFIVLQSL